MTGGLGNIPFSDYDWVFLLIFLGRFFVYGRWTSTFGYVRHKTRLYKIFQESYSHQQTTPLSVIMNDFGFKQGQESRASRWLTKITGKKAIPGGYNKTLQQYFSEGALLGEATNLNIIAGMMKMEKKL